MKWLFILTLLTAAQGSLAASFDCSKASRKVENLVCQDADLSRFDEELSAAYKDVARTASDPKELRSDQRKWIARRNECANTDCLREMYLKRLRDLPRYQREYEVVYSGTVMDRAVSDETLSRFPEGLKAILALYALAAGTDCVARDAHGLLLCALSGSLGLGPNCSKEHLALVSSWFGAIPDLWTTAGLPASDIKGSQALSRSCYNFSTSVTEQSVWEVIRMSNGAADVSVDATKVWTSRERTTRIRYLTTFKIDGHNIKVLKNYVDVISEDDN